MQIVRLQTFMGHKEKEAMINTFVHSNFNYGCLMCYFSSKKSQNKVERIHEKSLKAIIKLLPKQLYRTS